MPLFVADRVCQWSLSSNFPRHYYVVICFLYWYLYCLVLSVSLATLAVVLESRDFASSLLLTRTPVLVYHVLS